MSDKNKQYTWEKDENEELWRHDTFESIEDCILDAKENYEHKVGDIIYIGETELYIPSVDAESILENIEEQAYETIGECAENWDIYDYKKREELYELSNELTEVVNNWLKKYNREPSFYSVVDVKPIEIK